MINKSLFGLFIIFAIIFQNSQTSPTLLINDKNKFTASSYATNHEPNKALLKHVFTRSNDIWCPKNKVGKELKEWIQVDLQKLVEIKSILKIGMSSGNKNICVKTYYLEYRRDNSSRWHRAIFKKDGKEKEKSDACVSSVDIPNFNTFFARIIRIVPYSDVPTRVCTKFNIASAKDKLDGVIEYRMEDGDGDFRDKIYDGNRTNKFLTNGIGALSNNLYELPKQDNARDKLVGWSRKSRTKNNITIWFKFDRIYKFKEVSFYMLNNYQKNYSVYSKVRIESSVAGTTFSHYAKPVTSKYIPDRKLLSPRWANVSLSSHNLIGQYIKIDLFFDLNWMILSEITFKADPYLVPINPEPSGKLSKPQIDPEEYQNESIMNYNYLMYILGVICFLIITFACMGFVLLRMRSNRLRLLKSSALPIGCSVSNHSPGTGAMLPQVTNGHVPHIMYNGGGQVEMMHNGNYVVNGANSFTNGKQYNGYIDNNNGTILGTMQHGHMYKPVLNNGFDSINTYQSQTFNFRKNSSNSATTLQGPIGQHQYFGTLKTNPTSVNNNSSINGCGTMIPNSNHNNSAAMTPLLNSHNYPNNNNMTTNQLQNSGMNNVLLYPTENKRASYDGSYAGTGSNGEYSTTSMIREPMTTLPMTSLPPPPPQQSNVSTVNCSDPYAIQPCLFNYPNTIGGPPPPPIQLQHQPQQQEFNNDYYYGNSGNSNHNMGQPLPTWSEQVQMIVKNHLDNNTPLESPVGGSLIVPYNQKSLDANDPSQLQESIQRSEQVIMDNTTCLEKDDLDIHNCIGVGQLGKIYKAKYKGSSVIVKALDEECDRLSRYQFLQSVTDLLHISCNNLTKVIGYCKYSVPQTDAQEDSDESFGIINYILTEDTKYTDLCTFIRGHNSYEVNGANVDNGQIRNEVNSLDDYDEAGARMNLSQSCLVYISTQISDGMSVLEQEGLLHRDLSARNCLLGPRLSVLITDTAMTNADFYKDYMKLELDPSNNTVQEVDESIRKQRSHVLLPLRWMSPEAALWAQYSLGSDVWSFGVVLWEILTGCTRRPFDAIEDSIDESGSSGILMNHMLLLSSNQQPPSSNDSSALLPSNETLNQIINKHSQINNQNTSHTNSVISREIRDLIHSCWSVNVADRPKFADISTFLRRKINGFNADEEYQTLCMKTKNSLSNNNNVQTVLKSF